MRNVPKWSNFKNLAANAARKCWKIFLSVSDEFRTLCIKGLNISPRKYTEGH